MAWTHEEARRHSLVERLIERCKTFSISDTACIDNKSLSKENWCERCLAADLLKRNALGV